MILPAIYVSDNFSHPVNILWGFIYGFGWYLSGFIYDIRSPSVQIFGSMIWPAIVFISASYLFGRILSAPSNIKRLAIIIAVASLFIVLPEHLILDTPLKYIPVYYSILAAAY
jgi:hypothetical protein